MSGAGGRKTKKAEIPRLPERPDYGEGRTPTAHSIIFGGSSKPMGAISLEKPPNKPQGPHVDGRAGLEKAIGRARKLGELSKIRSALLPPIGPVMQAGLDQVQARVPHRYKVLESHRLARSASLDRHELEHVTQNRKRKTPAPNTEAHAASLLAATDLHPYSTTHHLGRKAAAKKFTDGKGEASKRSFVDLYDSKSVNASSSGRPGLRAEYEGVSRKRAATLQPYLDAVEPPTKKLRKGSL